MGNSVFGKSGLLSNRDSSKVSDSTVEKIEILLDVLRANPKISVQRLEALLSQIPKVRTFYVNRNVKIDCVLFLLA